jgi:HEPN domain-containing protein
LSFEEGEVLRERADAFLENAKHLIKTGSYDLELQIKTLLDREDNMLLVSLK